MNSKITAKEVEELALQALGAGEYEAADRFLTQILYESSPEVGKEVLSEQNMILKLWTEILLCEQNHGIRVDSFRSFQGSYDGFYVAYQRLKRRIRRIWFGLDPEDQAGIRRVLEEHPVSPDMLAVIAKYSVPPGFWGDTFRRILELLPSATSYERGISEYLSWMERSGISGKEKCTEPRQKKYEWSLRRLNYTGETSGDQKERKEKMLAVILCCNDPEYARECTGYLSYLGLPEGYSGEILEIWDAPSMAAGYRYGMQHTAAKYKLYIHQDTLLLDEKLPEKLIRFFEEDPGLGMLGVFGTTRIPESCRWAESGYEDSVLSLWQDAILNFLPPKKVELPMLKKAEAIDGAFLATAVDLPWREDLFDGWHFYDISQCFEMRRAGYGIGLIEDPDPWILHESTLRKDPEDHYGRYCGVFRDYYGEELETLRL